jgi:hypothetical protein
MVRSLAEVGGCFALRGGFLVDREGDGDVLGTPFVWIPGGMGRFTFVVAALLAEAVVTGAMMARDSASRANQSSPSNSKMVSSSSRILQSTQCEDIEVFGRVYVGSRIVEAQWGDDDDVEQAVNVMRTGVLCYAIPAERGQSDRIGKSDGYVRVDGIDNYDV